MMLRAPLGAVPPAPGPVVLSGIVDQENRLLSPGGDVVFMSLVNIEEETVGKTQLPYRRTANDIVLGANPDIKLNTYILFASHSDNNDDPGFLSYGRALSLLDQVVFFFQAKNVFTANQYPALLDAEIEKLIVEPVSLTFEQLNHMWATLGAKYMPSIVFKCRMLMFIESGSFGERPLIHEVAAESNVKK